MKKILITLLLSGTVLFGPIVQAEESQVPQKETKAEASLSLITENAEEGFQLAITLSRRGVKAVQPNKEILFEQREIYAKNADSLIASSQVIAIHFQTIAAANNYWRK